MSFLTLIFTSFLAIALAFKDPHYVGNRTTMVHLFEWKFCDIAKECEDFLGPMGYAGVQVSPINENLIIKDRPWHERYQPISYKIISRSGNETEFKDMVERCNKVGVRIYVDVCLNHMAGDANPANGTGGSTANPGKRCYPGVPYSSCDFHPPCQICNYTNATEVRNCELSGTHDLDQSKPCVREKIVAFLNLLISIGVAGFRIGAAKYMWPKDLECIYEKLNPLSTKCGFPPNSKPFIYQEVNVLLGEVISPLEYTNKAAIINFDLGVKLGKMCRAKDKLADLKLFIDLYGKISLNAIVMIDNHDNQRGHDAGISILTHKEPGLYSLGVCLMLCLPFGLSRIMSSFVFSHPNQGPPNLNGSIISPIFGDGLCINGWVCEHRWPHIYRMVKFRNLVNGTSVENWWTNGDHQIAFSRGNLGFIACTTKGSLRAKLQTGLLPGIYCDCISGDLVNGTCTGKSVKVDKDGCANIQILNLNVAANILNLIVLHIGAKLL